MAQEIYEVIEESISLSLGRDIIAIILEMVSCEKCSSPIYGCPKCSDNTRQVCLGCSSATCVNCDKAICYEHTVPKVYPFICQGDCYHKRGPSWGWFRKLEKHGSNLHEACPLAQPCRTYRKKHGSSVQCTRLQEQPRRMRNFQPQWPPSFAQSLPQVSLKMLEPQTQYWSQF
jgi:hypothetical protein